MIVNIIGGLGNQMFQYAFGYAASREASAQLKLDISGFDDYPLRNYALGCFCLESSFATNNEIEELKFKPQGFLKKILSAKRDVSKFYYQELHFHYDKNTLSRKEKRYYHGYWQSEKYFSQYRKELIELFQLKKALGTSASVYLEDIQSSNSVSLHVRRGDYVTDSKTNTVHGTCSLDYYKKAIAQVLETNPNAKFFVFSDDLNWCVQNFGFIQEVAFVKLDDTASDYEEMYLMSQCKHNIIANSSFSWWGAWLNQSPNKMVVAPKRWFTDESINTNDLIPESWIRI